MGGLLVIHAHMCLPVPPVTGPGGGGADDKLPSAGTLRLTATVMRAEAEISAAHRHDIIPGRVWAPDAL